MSTNQIAAPATFSAFDADALLAELDNTQDDTYDLALNAGIAARESLDQGRYIIGDLAAHIGKRYGDDLVGQFAEGINCRTASVREYRRVCQFWTRPARRQLFDEMPGLCYSMVRDSVRFRDPSKALEYLRKCIDEDWKCERAHMECNRLLGSEAPEMFKVLDVTTADFVFSYSRIEVFCDIDGEMIRNLEHGNKFRFVVYKLNEDAK